jgi:hypothetical membrane protein
MSESDTSRRWTEIGLIAGIAVPILYFGIQAVTMPLYPGYDPLRQPASALGSDSAPWGWVFNTGAILTGLATFAAAYGIGRALAVLGSWRMAAALAALALVSSGAASINAGLFHLPDPRHNPGWLGIGTFVFPLVMLIAAWPLPGSRGLKAMLLACVVAFAALAPVMAGATAIDRAAYGGLLQRLVALALFLPVGVGACWLLRRLRSAPSA